MKKILFILALLFLLTSCADVEPELNVYVVEFDSNGGTEVADIEVTEGDVLELPEDPTMVIVSPGLADKLNLLSNFSEFFESVTSFINT